MKYKPLKNYVFIKEVKQEEVTKGGIILQRKEFDDDNKKTEGEVMAVGSECKEVQVGDWAIYGKYTGITLTIDDETVYQVMPEDAIYGIGQSEVTVSE